MKSPLTSCSAVGGAAVCSAPACFATDSTSETTATAVGEPPAPDPKNDVSPPKTPRTVTRFWLPSTRPKLDPMGTSAGRTAANTAPLSSADARAIWRMVHPSCRA